MKRIEIVCNWNGLAFELYDSGKYRGNVLTNSSYFEVDRLIGQTELGRKLKYLFETSKTLSLLNDVKSELKEMFGEKYRLYL